MKMVLELARYLRFKDISKSLGIILSNIFQYIGIGILLLLISIGVLVAIFEMSIFFVMIIEIVIKIYKDF
jgi:hypothetical protein